MKILVSILTHEGTQSSADACIKTWVKDIKAPHEYYFCGSKAQSQKMDRTWDCEPNHGEHRNRLPEKTYKMLTESLKHEWDFLFKCDDDTFVVFDKLIDLLKNYNPNDELYIGLPIVNESKRFEDEGGKPIAYAQGGAGYVLTRGAVRKCIKSLEHIYNDKFKNQKAEDYSVALALIEQGIKLTATKWLTSHTPDRARKNQALCVDDIVNQNVITTHYVGPETMLRIYDELARPPVKHRRIFL